MTFYGRLLVFGVLLGMLVFSACSSDDDSSDGDGPDGDTDAHTDGDAGDGDEPDGDGGDGDEPDGDTTDGDQLDGDTDIHADGDEPDGDADIDPSASCELPRELLVGSCMVGTASCYEYYHESTADSLSENCVNTYHGVWSDGPCTTHSDLVLTGICRLESESLGHLYESRWSYTPEFIPGYVAQLNDSMAGSCQNLSSDPLAWCSIEDGSGVELDCSRKTAAGICNMQSFLPQCVEYGDAATAETACASITDGFQAESNCPSADLVGWCNNIGASQDFFYYDAASVTEDTIASCNGMGGWCSP